MVGSVHLYVPESPAAPVPYPVVLGGVAQVLAVVLAHLALRRAGGSALAGALGTSFLFLGTQHGWLLNSTPSQAWAHLIATTFVAHLLLSRGETGASLILLPGLLALDPRLGAGLALGWLLWRFTPPKWGGDVGRIVMLTALWVPLWAIVGESPSLPQEALLFIVPAGVFLLLGKSRREGQLLGGLGVGACLCGSLSGSTLVLAGLGLVLARPLAALWLRAARRPPELKFESGIQLESSQKVPVLLAAVALLVLAILPGEHVLNEKVLLAAHHRGRDLEELFRPLAELPAPSEAPELQVVGKALSLPWVGPSRSLIPAKVELYNATGNPLQVASKMRVRFFGDSGPAVLEFFVPVDLEHLEPGNRKTLEITLSAPAEAGLYLLELSLESPTGRIPVFFEEPLKISLWPRHIDPHLAEKVIWR